jgi:hypothetical protein
LIKQGTKIAGPAQARVYPSKNATTHGIPKRYLEITAADVASKAEGINVNIATMKAFPSKDMVNPPLTRRRQRQISLILPAQSS